MQGKRADVLIMLSCVDVSILFAAISSRNLAFEVFHALPRTAHSYNVSWFFGFCAAKVGNGHRHCEALVLERVLRHECARFVLR
jgi:hypothetical protein